MNRRHRSAQLAGRASVQLHTLIFFASTKATEEDAYVLDVETAEQSDPSFTVIVPRYGIEGRVILPIEVDDPKLVRMPNEHKIVYDNTTSIQVFDKIRVSIHVQSDFDHQRELVIKLIDPIIGSSSPSSKRTIESSPIENPAPSNKKRKSSKKNRK
jgi:exosome complex exonuclease DIS3/RRP44